ncbi:hypothetical protein [Massilia sp. ST3]|uniref:hypothetical protein n=1 Tax=Massilia sp. ST3 TaxID=2824903 RepID=UPI001B81361C|nr:hypothetical protein [Massilia sp. ST3]MBQ5947226.1 hypothetical protein [Massilia sp. ST3]
MSAYLVCTLAACEARLRLRRLSTLAALLAVMAVSWAMIEDPAGGKVLIALDGARVLYTSSALAMGSATLAGVLFGLAGFYLLRGRSAEDLRSGIGGVIGATPAGNAALLAGRWLGGVAYLGILVFAFMLTILACHLLRGDGPIQLAVYLQTYVLVLGPMVLFAASCALLFDSWAPLMGKAGDLLYFFIWVATIATGPQMIEEGKAAAQVLPLAMAFDFMGMGHAMAALSQYADTSAMAIGSMPYDPKLPVREFPQWLWYDGLVRSRALSALAAMLPLLPALPLFHRFSPDRVKAGKARERRTPLAVLNAWLRPLSRLVQPLFGLAARLPDAAGQALADVALALATAPAAIAALGAALAAGLVLPADTLPGLVLACVAFWGVFVSDTATRDFSAGCDDLGAAVPGGANRRFLRQFLASILLGWMFMGIPALRWLADSPERAAAVVGGVVALAAFAALLGQLSRTPRLFLGLFLFGLYVAVNARDKPMLDMVGFNGAATAQSVTTLLAAGLAALAAGYAWSRRR